MIKMNCNICPVSEECDSARRVAKRSLVGTDRSVSDRIQIICPLEEVMYTTFRLAIYNLKREADKNE